MKERNPFISVVMPVYNGEKYLDEAIQSILTQTYEDFEFIIINDGSTDSSLEIIEKYKNQDERIILISRENRGLIASLNEGIEKARGQYIARMDADDISLPTRFEKQLKQMIVQNADFCGCNFIVIDEDGNSLLSRVMSTSKNLNRVILARSTPFAHGSVLMKKSFLNKNNLMYGDTKYDKAEDYALWIQSIEKNAVIINVDDFLFKYRDIGESLSKNKINYLHAMSLSKMYINRNATQLFDIIQNNKKKLNEFELDNISYFLIKTFYKFNFFQVFSLLRKIPARINIINLFRIIF